MNPFRLCCTTRCRKNPGPREARRLPRAALPFGVLLLVASLLWMPAAQADEGLLRGPRKILRTAAEAAAVKPGTMENVAAAPVLFYRRFLGSSWGHRCPSYPSCSEYALLAIRKHGAFLGSIMTFDRLQHESDEVRYSPQILAGGIIKVYDPLENNDYWWYSLGHSDPGAPESAKRETMP